MGGPQEEALRGLREGPGQGVASSPQLQAAQGVANDLQTRMPGGPKIRVVETTEEIASEYGARVAGRLMRNRPEAFYDPRTDTVVVIAENAHPIEGESHEAYFTLKILREAAGHGGLSRLFHNPEAQPSVFLFANWVADRLSEGKDDLVRCSENGQKFSRRGGLSHTRSYSAKIGRFK